MPIKAHEWTTLDVMIAEYFAEMRSKKEHTYSLRDLEARTGIRFVRIGDILNAKNGVPSLFDLDPAQTLNLLIHRAKIRDLESKSKRLLSLSEQAREAAALDRDVAETLERVEKGMYGLAANWDPNKEKEQEDYY